MLPLKSPACYYLLPIATIYLQYLQRVCRWVLYQLSPHSSHTCCYLCIPVVTWTYMFLPGHTCCYLDIPVVTRTWIPAVTWTYLVSPGHICCHLDIPVVTWTYLLLTAHTCCHLDTPVVTWTYLLSPGHTCCHLAIPVATWTYLQYPLGLQPPPHSGTLCVSTLPHAECSVCPGWDWPDAITQTHKCPGTVHLDRNWQSGKMHCQKPNQTLTPMILPQ